MTNSWSIVGQLSPTFSQEAQCLWFFLFFLRVGGELQSQRPTKKRFPCNLALWFFMSSLCSTWTVRWSWGHWGKYLIFIFDLSRLEASRKVEYQFGTLVDGKWSFCFKVAENTTGISLVLFGLFYCFVCDWERMLDILFANWVVLSETHSLTLG